MSDYQDDLPLGQHRYNDLVPGFTYPHIERERIRQQRLTDTCQHFRDQFAETRFYVPARHVYMGHFLLEDHGTHPCLLDIKSFLHGVHFLGPARSGKSARAADLFDQWMRVGGHNMQLPREMYPDDAWLEEQLSFVVIDAKGSNDLAHQTFLSSRQYGYPYRLFSLAPDDWTHLFNPMSQSLWRYYQPFQKPEVLMRALSLKCGREWNARYWEGKGRKLLEAICYKDPKSLRDAAKYNYMPPDKAAEDLALTDDVYIEKGDHALTRFNAFVHVPGFNPHEGDLLGAPREILPYAMDLRHAFTKPMVLHYKLNSERFPEMTEDVIPMIVALTVAAANTVPERQRRRVILVVDEAHILQDLAATIVSKCIGQGISPVLMHQSPSQFDTATYSVIHDNLSMRLIFGANNYNFARDIVQSAGTSFIRKTLPVINDIRRMNVRHEVYLLDDGVHARESLSHLNAFPRFIENGFHIGQQEYRRRCTSPLPRLKGSYRPVESGELAYHPYINTDTGSPQSTTDTPSDDPLAELLNSIDGHDTSKRKGTEPPR